MRTRRYTPLLAAVEYGQLRVVKLLLKVRTRPLSSHDLHGRPQSPSISHNLPASLTISQHLSQSPSISHNLPASRTTTQTLRPVRTSPPQAGANTRTAPLNKLRVLEMEALNRMGSEPVVPIADRRNFMKRQSTLGLTPRRAALANAEAERGSARDLLHQVPLAPQASVTEGRGYGAGFGRQVMSSHDLKESPGSPATTHISRTAARLGSARLGSADLSTAPEHTPCRAHARR